MGPLRSITLSFALLLAANGLSYCVSPCDVNPLSKTVERDGHDTVTQGATGVGSPATARQSVRGGVCGALSVIHGTVTGLEPVRATGGVDTLQTLLGVAVARSWKTTLEGEQEVRLREDLMTEPRQRPRYAPFEMGDECLLYLLSDSFGELVALPSSLVLRDSLILGMWALKQQIAREEVFALVDSCAADCSLAAMVRKADLVIEGDVLVAWEDWLGRGENACLVELGNVDVHKGTLAGDEFELSNKRGFDGWCLWPAFGEGERVLLFLVESEAIRGYVPVAGWQGKWTLGEDGSFHIGTLSSHDRREGTDPREVKRASPSPDRILTRQELARALEESHDTLPN